MLTQDRKNIPAVTPQSSRYAQIQPTIQSELMNVYSVESRARMPIEWMIRKRDYSLYCVDMPFKAIRKKNCWMIGSTMETVFSKTRAPWGVGMMSSVVELIALRNAVTAAADVVFRLVMAVGLTPPYAPLTTPTRVRRLPERCQPKDCEMKALNLTNDVADCGCWVLRGIVDEGHGIIRNIRLSCCTASESISKPR